MDKLKLEKLSIKPVSSAVVSEDINSTVMQTLRCACKRYLYAPIRQCRSGHCLCSHCSDPPSRRMCPECGSPVIQARNLALEAIAAKLLIACVYRTAGCLEVMPQGYGMLVHEHQCLYRPYDCFAAKCAWTGQAHTLLAHMEKSHRERVFVGFEKVFKVKKIENREEMDMMFLFSCLNNLFWVKLIYRKTDTTFFGAVQYVGNINTAGKYSYSFEVKSEDEKSKKLFRFDRKTHEDIVSFDVIFGSHDCFCFPISIAKYFAESDAISINLTIQSVAQH
ncbi:E3 ubiquitin-protein ligase Siah1-like [Periplaneta americana]|uniref:E3 ubiquitin-protein ligase n=1 Tax=Periplaneta americana TaxID=6978 RepID=A0ABQ8S577_PERAM|nr:hypothetical protein ANN_25986 [Periplaneta americana]